MISYYISTLQSLWRIFKNIRIALSKLRIKILNLFTFNIYIRMIIESFQYLLIGAWVEIYTSNTSDGVRKASYIFSIIIAISCYLFIILSFLVIWCSVRPQTHNIFGEFFIGLKQTFRAKIYTPLQLIRKLLFIFALTLLSFAGYFAVIVVWGCIQLAFLAYIVIVRPFELKRDMFIEIINEIFFLFILCWMSHFNTYELWNNMLIFVFVTVMMCNNIIIMVIVSSKSNRLPL